MSAGPSSMWPVEREAALKEHWDAGQSASKIAAALGISRNAVLGKAHRMKLQMRAAGGNGQRAPKPRSRNVEEDRARSRRYYREVTKLKAKANAAVKQNIRGSFYRNRGAPKEASIPPEPIPAPDMRMITLMDLTGSTCPFPIGDPKKPGFGYCGAEKALERPYCRYHHGIAYHAVTERRMNLERLICR